MVSCGPAGSKDRVQLLCLICLLHVREGRGCERRVVLEALTLLAPSRVGSCVPSVTSGTLPLCFLLPPLHPLSGLHLRLLCGGLEAEMGRWGWSKLHPLEEGQSSFLTSCLQVPFSPQLWVPLGTRLTPPSLRPAVWFMSSPLLTQIATTCQTR